MQSRLVVSKLNRILFPKPKCRSFSSGVSANGGDREMEDSMTQGVDTQGETLTLNDQEQDEGNDVNIIPTKEDHHYIHPTRNSSSSKLQTPGVNKPFDPQVQQKRRISKEDLSCAGLDGSPWPDDGEVNRREENDKEYFGHHKASPLSEIEIVDSRKPVARVLDGTAGGYFGDEQVVTWRPEQLDTAEESLLRGRKMFEESARRGVPEWPHSRRLRQLRGEDW